MTRSTLFSRLGILVLAGATITCSSNEPNPPPEAAVLAMAGGNSQSAPAGQALANPIGVRVTDDNGDPVADVTVGWSAADGGSVSASSVSTDDDGRASVTWTLGPTAGSQTATATVDGLDGSPVQFTATAVETGEITLTVTQQPPGSVLATEVFAPEDQPAVRLLDSGGAPMAGEVVTASVESGGGTLQGAATATTDANGIAAFADLGIDGSGDQVLGFSAAGASVSANAVNLQPLPPEATTGRWDAPVQWDIVPLHMSLLPSGKILAWGRNEYPSGLMGQPRLWDPTSGAPGAATEVDADTMLFCAGHALMADGNLMVSGGHKLDDRGLDVTHIFDWQTERWNDTPLPKMAKGRWYPTVTTLADGRLVTIAGKDTAKKVVTIPEVWESDHWVQLTGASLTLPYYPRDFVDPKNGRVFMAGERVQSRWLDVDANGGAGQWIGGPAHKWGFNRDYGSAVMYDEGKIMYVGGGGYTGWDTPDPTSPVPTASAEIIDLKASAPSWSYTGSMAQPRRHLNATVLPDGKVLVTGGVSGGGFNDLASAVHTAELWDPANPGTWTPLAANSVDRAYHSVSILLPDGTVLHGASGDANIPGTNTPYTPQRNHEIFHPPYLFRGARPVISDAPTDVTANGAAFQVVTPNAAQVTAVRWIHLGAVTHSFDQSARANTLAFTRQGDGVSVTAPSSANSAPPGHYLLFILNRNGVPSTGRIIRVH
jgi:galactose oxidase-like protein/Big-like domain-containing protein